MPAPDLAAHLAGVLSARSIWRSDKAEQWPDARGNAEAADTLSRWAAELAAMPLDDPVLEPLLALATATGAPDGRTACDALGLEPYTDASAIGFQRSDAASLAELLSVWTRQAERRRGGL